MKIIDKFHKMETEFSLFDLDNGEKLPLWDIIRYDVYLKYYYPEKDRLRFENNTKHSKWDYIMFFQQVLLFLFKFVFLKSKNVFFTASRYIDDAGKFFDKSAQGLIESCKGDYIVMEPTVLKLKMKNRHLYDFSNVFRKFHQKDVLNRNDFVKIQNALKNEFGECLIDFKEINRILLNFKSDYTFYKWFFKSSKTNKIFISVGNPRSIILAARDYKISSHLVQHASIEDDSVDLSYPKNINSKSNILFADYVLTYGDFWCKNINVPTKQIISIGNDYFFNKPNLSVDNSILIISTIIHGDELKILAKKIASQRDDLVIVYKLHPNEYKYYQDYVFYFSEYRNVKIITNQIDTNSLISKSLLVVLIVSTVLYEALNQNKKVAVYKKINYGRQLHLSHLNNLYFFDEVSELLNIVSVDVKTNSVDFYIKSDYEVMKKLVSSY